MVLPPVPMAGDILDLPREGFTDFEVTGVEPGGVYGGWWLEGHTPDGRRHTLVHVERGQFTVTHRPQPKRRRWFGWGR